MKVYLSGGMRSGWMGRAEGLLETEQKVNIISPKKHGLKSPDEYSLYDTWAVAQSDVVLAYMEETNPSGWGLALEIGIAVGRGIPVVFVQDELEEPRGRYFALIRHSVTQANDLESACALIRKMARV